MNRIQKAWREGFRQGRWERARVELSLRRGPDPDIMRGCQYSTHWPGIQCRIAYREGYHAAWGALGYTQQQRRVHGV